MGYHSQSRVGEYPLTVGSNRLKLYRDSRLFGGKVRYYYARARENEMVIPEALRRVVAFLCYTDKKDRKLHYAGTCFFFGLMPPELAQDTSDGFFRYTITAKHVIVGIKEKSMDGKVILRVNKKNGGVDYIDTDVSDWIYDEENPSDVALYNDAPLPTDGFYVTYIMSDMIQKEDVEQVEKVRLGDDVFIIGLFANHKGKKRNTPIVRAGNVALLADENELVETAKYGDMYAHLIESRSIGGLSGSPVYVNMTAPRIDDDGKALLDIHMRYIYLFGLIYGHYDIETPGEDQIVEDETKQERINMGIAIVVPASKIKELLYHPKMVKVREDEIKEIKSKNIPTEDSLEDKGEEKPLTKEAFEDVLKQVSRPVKKDAPKKKGT